MQFVIADLEWNGTYNRKIKHYFNEIIEIGAVKLNSKMEEIGRFHAVIRPLISSKLSDAVQDLTNITEEELEHGIYFTQAVSRLKKWMSAPSTVFLTWSTTDLLVLLENYRYFCKTDRIPFLQSYADLQAYCQERIGVGTVQQMGLSKACDVLEIVQDGMELHRALDDSLLTASIMQKVYEPDSFQEHIYLADDAFYERINFKNTIVDDLQSPLVDRRKMRFVCPVCGKKLRRLDDWRFRSRWFCAAYLCKSCGDKYCGRVQFKQKYEGVTVRKKLAPYPPRKEPKTEEAVHTVEEKERENGRQEQEELHNQ